MPGRSGASTSLRWLLWTAALFAFAAHAPRSDAQPSVIRIGMPLVADTLDPARSDNVQANMVMAGIYDTLYALDPVASPPAIVPIAAESLPELSADRRTLTIRVRPGIFFTPHARFGGKPRELTATDFAYAIKRVHDPRIRSPGLYLLESKIEGMEALAKQAADAGRAIDYDAPVPGLAVDRNVLKIRLNAPDPVFPFLLTSPLTAALAREVVEAEGDSYGHRPVGTGAFRVEAFTPGQRLALVRNRDFRTMHWEDLLTTASRAAQAPHALRGRRLPAVDRLELSSTPEYSAELLALRSGQLDLINITGAPELATQNGRLKPELERTGIKLVRDKAPSTLLSFFNMRDSRVGGNARERIALRRAIQMAFDDGEWIRVLDAGFSSPRQQVVPPGVEGHIAGYRNPNNFDRATANALLDRFGYKRGSDGYRRNPDGSALTIESLTGTSAEARRAAEFEKRMLDRIGVRVAFEALPAAERLKRMAQCRYGMATMDWSLDVPDGTNVMSMFYSKSIGGANISCYADAEFDAAYEKALVTPPGAERDALFRTMQTRLDVYVPARPRPVSDTLLLKRSHVVGPFGTMNDWLQLVTLSVDKNVVAGSTSGR